MSNEVIDLKEYKKAKVLVKELEELIKIINLSINALSMYKKYVPVMECISMLQSNKTILEIHYHRYKRLIEKKK